MMKKIDKEKLEGVKEHILHERKMFRLESNLLLKISDTWNVFCEEMRRIFHDPGVIVLFFVAPLLYPLLYNVLYWNNELLEVPVAVVDMDHSTESRRFIHEWNATPEVEVTHICVSMHEAEYMVKHGIVRGILYIPNDFNNNLASGLKTATLSLFCDMSSMLYMKNVYLSANKVMLDNMYTIQIERYAAMNMDPELSWAFVQAAPYEENIMYVESGGYGHFLVPCVLVLILHQTLLLGISMLTGTAAQENREVFILPGRRRRYSILRILLGRGAAYFAIYMALSCYVLFLIPNWFGLPHVGQVGDILRWMVPFLLATIYFGISLTSFMKERETGLVMLMPTSLIFLFMSGVSWPEMAMPDIWSIVSVFIPYTLGVHGFLHLNSMGGTLSTVPFEYTGLWIMAACYFGLSCLLYLIRSKHYKHLQSKGLTSDEDSDERARRELDALIHDEEEEQIRAMEISLYNALNNVKHNLTRLPDDDAQDVKDPYKE